MEYCLQKKSLRTWQYVTWYNDLDQAKRNFNVASKEGNGYSWRLVEVTVLEEKLLDGERKAEPGDDMPIGEASVNLLKSDWGSKPTEPAKSSWGTSVASGWGKPTSEPAKSEHGLSGSVWLGNRELGQKKRVPAAEVDAMLKQGWFKAGPRTVL